MAQVSRYPIPKEVADRIFDIFIKTLIKVKYESEAKNLASDLFSPTEKIMLAKRLSIAFLLMKDYEYREISRMLKVSLTTIASVSLSLKFGSNGYKVILERIAKEEKLEEFFLNIAEKSLSLPAKVPTGGGSWRYLLEEVRKSKKKKLKQF